MRLLTLLCIVAMTGCSPSEEDVQRIVREEFASAMQRSVVVGEKTIGPYSPAVRVGGFLFVSGQIGLDTEGRLRNDSIEEETRQVLENLMRILRREGFDSSHVISTTVYMKNLNDFAKMNLIYGGYFSDGDYPARATVEVSGLPRQANIEMSLIAYKP